MAEAKKRSLRCRLAAVFCMGAVLAACVPRSAQTPEEDLFLTAGPPVSLSGDMSMGPADLDREISLASSKPEALVGANSMGVSELSEDVEARNDPLALSELPSELLVLDGKGLTAFPRQNISLPKPGSAEEKRLAAMHTQQSLCNGSETLCITSPYGVKRSSRRYHKGIDIRAPMGSPIMAFRSGVVVKSEYHHSYGYMIEIQQDDGLIARYAHMSQLIARKGDRVQPGLMIGRVGSTGRSTGPHLHFELLRDNKQMNPMVLLPTPKQVVTKATPEDVAAVRKAAAARKSAKKSAVKKSSSKKTTVTKKTSSSKKTTATKTTASSAKKTTAGGKTSGTAQAVKKTEAKTASQKAGSGKTGSS